MRETVTVSLTKEIRKELDKVARQEGVSRSDLIRESLRDFLFIRNFRRLRARLRARAQAQDIYKDEDVFERVT